MKEQKSLPQEIIDSVKPLIAPAEADFRALVPQVMKLICPDSELRGYQNHGIHGLGHIYRVLLLSLIYYYNSGDSLTPADKNVLAYFAILHDVGRTNDGKDPSHGEKSLNVIEDYKIEIEGLDLTEEDRLIASIVIPGHCNGEKREQVKKAIPEGPTRDRALKLYCICKDMDGLDRVRFSSGVTTDYLRTDYAKRMVGTAEIIYHGRLARRLAESAAEKKFRIERANIVDVDADAIVLPANETLTCWTEKGSYGAIFKAAGKEKLNQACKEVLRNLREQGEEKCAIGSAVVTPAFDLDADWIIHAVVPTWEGGEYEEYGKLCSAYLSALALADCLECKSIAFPLLSSGHNKFSKELAIQVAAECFNKFQGKNIEEIILVLYGDSSVHRAKQLGYKVHETYSGPHKEHEHHAHHGHHNHHGHHDHHKKPKHPGVVEKAMKQMNKPEVQKAIWQAAIKIGANIAVKAVMAAVMI